MSGWGFDSTLGKEEEHGWDELALVNAAGQYILSSDYTPALAPAAAYYLFTFTFQLLAILALFPYCSCWILQSRIGEHGVSLENMGNMENIENMEKMENME